MLIEPDCRRTRREYGDSAPPDRSLMPIC